MTDFDKIAAQIWCEPKHSSKEMDVDFAESIVATLRKAVADERERCAKICEAESGPGFSCRHVDHSQGFCECAAKAAAIRAPINT